MTAMAQGVVVPGAPQVGGNQDGVRELALPTLHVYTNLIQIPVLVLSRMRTPVAPVAESRFTVSLDAGPAFKPTHVRVEGDDPISLTIVLDPSGSAQELSGEVTERIPRMAGGELQARDHVSMYIRSCALMRTGLDVSVDRPTLQLIMGHALIEVKKAEGRHGCRPNMALVDAVMAAAHQTAGLQGRRVMLVVSDGKDRGSKATWKDLREFAAAHGVAIFGLSAADSTWNGGAGRAGGVGMSTSSLNGLAMGVSSGHESRDEDLFGMVCELTGGMRMYTQVIDMGAELKWLLKLLRERYIVEFPRSDGMKSGAHDILVMVSKMNGFIRPSGVSVPLPDPRVMADPMTLPHDTTKDPAFGSRRILTPQP